MIHKTTIKRELEGETKNLYIYKHVEPFPEACNITLLEGLVNFQDIKKGDVLGLKDKEEIKKIMLETYTSNGIGIIACLIVFSNELNFGCKNFTCSFNSL